MKGTFTYIVIVIALVVVAVIVFLLNKVRLLKQKVDVLSKDKEELDSRMESLISQGNIFQKKLNYELLAAKAKDSITLRYVRLYSGMDFENTIWSNSVYAKNKYFLACSATCMLDELLEGTLQPGAHAVLVYCRLVDIFKGNVVFRVEDPTSKGAIKLDLSKFDLPEDEYGKFNQRMVAFEFDVLDDGSIQYKRVVRTKFGIEVA